MDLFQMPGHLIRRLHQRSTAVFQQEMKRAGQDLTPVQFAALQAIAAQPGIDQAGVAARIAYDRATIGGVIERLEHKGLVSRAVSPRDRRAPAGQALLSDIEGLVADLQARILPGLSREERRQFLALAKKATTVAEAQESQAGTGSDPGFNGGG